MDHITLALNELYAAATAALPIYAVIMVILEFWKKRGISSKQCTLELLLVIYAVVLIRQVGFASLRFRLDSPGVFRLVPFLGSAFLPVFFSFLLFLPLGLLIPSVFPSVPWNWKHILAIGAGISLVTELLQFFGGQCAEATDILMNILGSVTGFYLLQYLRLCIAKRKNAAKSRRS